MTKADGSPVEAAGAWLLSVLDGGGWAEAEAIEAEREAAGVSARALTTARGRLVQDGRIEKHKAGRGAWRYRLAGRVPESGPAPESLAPPATVTVPARFAATARFLADPAMAAPDVPDVRAVADALEKLAKDCGYTLEPHWSSYAPEAPPLVHAAAMSPNPCPWPACQP